MGIRNAKPTADREVLEEYIQHINTPVDDERHQSRPKQEDADAGEGRERSAEEAAGQCDGKSRDILWIEGITRVLVLLWADFLAILYGNTPFPYVSTVSCSGLALRSLLLPPEEAPA